MSVIKTAEFPELWKYHNVQTGTYPEFANIEQARRAFRQAMRARGYRFASSRVWVKPGMAAVMEPKHLKGPRARSSYR